MKKPLTFEAGMEELERLVAGLEGGELTLEDSFKAYERGVKLAAELKGILAEGDARVVALRATLTGVVADDISDEVAP